MKEKYLINYNSNKDLYLLRKLALYSSIYEYCLFNKDRGKTNYELFDISIFISHDLLSLVKIKSIYKNYENLKFIVLADGENISILSTLSEDNFIILESKCGIKKFKENLIYLKPKISYTLNITKREKQVLNLILKGQSNSQIAIQLGIKERTIETHRRNIYIKTGVHSISQLTLWAINNNMFNN